jgi:hypothetical protein
VLGASGGQALASPSATLVVSGRGGQSVVLSVGAGGLTLGYPFLTESRLPGPDGTIGGLVIQRLHDQRLLGGVLLQNAPGFDSALDLPLVGFDKTRLAPGRYRVTLLGTGRSSVHLDVLAGRAPKRLTAAGPARPITRTASGSGSPIDTWSERLGRLTASDYLVVGAGSGGAAQQGDDAALCVQPTAAAAGTPCIGGDGFGFSPGAGSASWSDSLYAPGDLKPDSYTFTGHAAGAGPSSVSGHEAVVISPLR